MAVACALLLAAVVCPVFAPAPRFTERIGPLDETVREQLFPTRTPEPAQSAVAQTGGPGVDPTPYVLATLFAGVLAVIVWALARWWRGRARVPERPTASVREAAAAPEEEIASQIARAASETRALVFGLEDADDAAIAAWIALERAAARAGTPRGPAQTPTEFTVDLLARIGVDSAAVDALLSLYLAARFRVASPAGVSSEAAQASDAAAPSPIAPPALAAGPATGRRVPTSPQAPESTFPQDAGAIDRRARIAALLARIEETWSTNASRSAER